MYYLAVNLVIPVTVPKVVYEDQVLFYTWPVHAAAVVLLLLFFEWISCKAWLVSHFGYILWISVMTNEVKLFLHELNIWWLLLPIIYSRLLPMFILSFPFFIFLQNFKVFIYFYFIYFYLCVCDIDLCLSVCVSLCAYHMHEGDCRGQRGSDLWKPEFKFLWTMYFLGTKFESSATTASE